MYISRISLSLIVGLGKFLGQILSLVTLIILFHNKLTFKGLMQILIRSHKELSALLQPNIQHLKLALNGEELRFGEFCITVFPSTSNLLTHIVIITVITIVIIIIMIIKIIVFFSFSICAYLDKLIKLEI